jgi:hypothetical protein
MASRKRAKAKGGQPLELGSRRRLYEAVWPVDSGRKGWDSRMRYLMASRRSKPGATSISWTAELLLGRRFARLIGYLAAGELEATGTTPDGQADVIPRSMWGRQETYLDLNNGDLIASLSDANDVAGDFGKPMFIGLMLRKAAPAAVGFPVKPIRPDEARSTTTATNPRSMKKSIVGAQARKESRQACTAWLEQKMRASPDERTESKPSLWPKAQKQWPGALSERSFEAAWADAVNASGALAWSAAGAPKKKAKGESGRGNRRTD